MSHVAQPSIPALHVRIRSRLVLWVGLGLAVAAGIAVALVLIINSSDQGSKTAAVPVSHAAPYTARPDEGLGTLTSQSSGYTARPDEGLAPISTQSTQSAQASVGGGPHRLDRHGQLTQSGQSGQPSFSGDRLGGPH